MPHPLMTRIAAATDYLASRVPQSPLLSGGQLRTSVAGRVWLKAESLLPTGSFKIRGATWRLSQLTAEEHKRGVIAYSTGNHAQAVAKAARDVGTSALIVMSPDVPRAKVKATERWGAEIVMAEPNSQARKALAEQLAREQRSVLVPPYDDDEIIAGQGSVGVELVRQWGVHPPAAVFVPIGGGGLIAGVALALKHLAPQVLVIGVEPELEDDAARSWRGGYIVGTEGPSNSIADAIKVQRVGDRTFPLMRQFVDDIVLVSEADIGTATLRTLNEAHLVIEPGGAASIAAALRTGIPGEVVAVASGGNVTLEALTALQQKFG
ncbi:threonine/serine dehydratase [Dokdonella soli]|uniref:Threo-3-hydroxy-L-aspartate ammonia-lyase n=1 Tax=Dokdonella soli TaxID=529810 RepID=A0ABN1IDW1_9GAMM